ncbi:hypothetical protein LC605_13845 [Nostoc sp. CHAB 5836]|uniref:hypothetical protein n=1 Tax=Nostoc sp. CHAB 5836 TaxID=2780404 RepID=UPI001E5BE0C0|nr:hypothetical protein [Nostoc sp. CHAB 5836]MCC5616129.1 hypothetical protein [Nostoc sp. CHAB 5836]
MSRPLGYYTLAVKRLIALGIPSLLGRSHLGHHRKKWLTGSAITSRQFCGTSATQMSPNQSVQIFKCYSPATQEWAKNRCNLVRW